MILSIAASPLPEKRAKSEPIEVLLVEDNPGDVRLIRESLSGLGLRVDLESVDQLQKALQRIGAGGVDVILLDLGLPDSRGADTFETARREAPGVPIIVLTGLGDEELALRLLQQGAQDYLIKGQVDGRDLIRAIRYAIERQRSERARLESQEQYRALIENAPYGIFTSGPEGTVHLANPAFAQILGFATAAEVEGLDLGELYADPGERDEILARSRAAGVMQGIEVAWRKRDGTPIIVRLSGRPVRDAEGALAHWDMMAEDVTQRKQLESQLLHSQRMESVGRLAGGVAHDFNNLLTVVLGECELCAAGMAVEDPRRESLVAIRRAAERGSLLTRQLLTFSRQQTVDPIVFTVNDLVRDMEKMLVRIIGEHIRLTASLSPSAGWVRADRGQIEQVLMNLVVNARDAMPKGGDLTIRTFTETLGSDEPSIRDPTEPGIYEALAVVDNGCGMDGAVRARLFEPFFTTKEVGKGTGLGLATSYGIVRQAGGYIGVRSELGRGTTMSVYLPRAEASAPRSTPHESDAPTTGSETILFVEDEEPLQRVGKRMLEARGYRVLPVGDAAAALKLLEARGQEIHLLLTDVVLPGMDGRELAARARRSHAGIRVLFMSGYTPDTFPTEQVPIPDRRLVEKPFTAEQLARKVREALDSPP